MTLADKINDGIKEAMKAREKEKLEALRSIKKVMLEAKSTKGAGSELDDEEVLKIIAKLAKQEPIRQQFIKNKAAWIYTNLKCSRWVCLKVICQKDFLMQS